MLARSLTGRLLRPRLAPPLAGIRGYSPRAPAAVAATDIVIEEDTPRPAPPVGVGVGVGAAAIAATVPTVLQPRVLIYDGVCHLCHRGERHPT
jgi:cytochrome c5